VGGALPGGLPVTPDYQADGVTLYHGDCRDVLPTLRAGSVDIVLTDPPYGVAVTMHRGRTGERLGERYRQMAGDATQEAGVAALAWAASRKLPTVAFAHPMNPWPGRWRQHLVWDKGLAVGGLGDYRRCWKATWELLQVARNRPLRRRRDGAVLRFHMPPGKKRHPAEKSVSLLCYLLEQLTDRGDVILDPFMGSGTTGVACLRTGRHFVGVEIDPGYFEIARKRLTEVHGPLFTPREEPA
jgi:site-specific DNA-methyltransferase (adenine-specific)